MTTTNIIFNSIRGSFEPAWKAQLREEEARRFSLPRKPLEVEDWEWDEDPCWAMEKASLIASFAPCEPAETGFVDDFDEDELPF